MGELDVTGYDQQFPNIADYFRLANLYNTIMFLFFVFMMCIIVLSLFEGIAVGEIKIVLDKAHLEILAANIVYVLKVQLVSYYVYRMFNKNREPTFMNVQSPVTFEESPEEEENEMLRMKKKTIDQFKRIDNSLTLIAYQLGHLVKQLSEHTNHMKYIKKQLKSAFLFLDWSEHWLPA